MRPFRCPVCDGCGKVPAVNSRSDNVAYEVCRACSGIGIVWGPPAQIVKPFLPCVGKDLPSSADNPGDGLHKRDCTITYIRTAQTISRATAG